MDYRTCYGVIEEARDEAREEGLEEGREEGLKEGRKKGLKEGRFIGIIEYLRSEGFDEKAIEGKLQEKYDLSPEEIAEYMKM